MARELLEREESVAALDAVLAGLRSGRGRALLIEGPAGVGKTALLDAAQERAGGLMVLRASGGEFERDVALGVLRQLFEPVLWRAMDSQRARWLRGPSEIAGRLLGVGRSGASVQGLGMDEAAVRSGFHWLAVALAEDTPLVLLIDDLQWVDPESLRWLLFTVRELRDTGIALIAATRAAEPGVEGSLVEALAHIRGVELVRPLPLSQGGTDRFVRRWPGFASAAPEFAAVCHELSGGHPFLLAELLGEAARVGLGPGVEDAARLRALVPEGVARAVLLRLRLLGAAAVGLARAVAVMGSGARLAAAAAVADLSVGSAVSGADALVRAGVFRDGQELELAHPLLRAAILSELTAAAQSALHARAARALSSQGGPPERVGAHLLFAPPCADQWVVDCLLVAAEEARARGAPEAAVRLLRRALAEPPAASLRPAVHAALGSALCHAGDPDGIEHVKRARELTEDPVRRAVLAFRLGAPYAFLGLGSEVETMFEAALDELGDRWPMLSFALRSLGVSLTDFGARFDPRPLLPELVEQAQRLSSPEPVVRAALAALALAACKAAFPVLVVVAIARRALGDTAAHRAAIDQGFPLFPALIVLALVALPAGGATLDPARYANSGLPSHSQPTATYLLRFTRVGAYRFYCLVHRAMSVRVRVVPNARSIPTPAQVQATARAQLQAAMALARRLERVTPPRLTVLAGHDAGPVAWMRFFPEHLRIRAGQTVTFHVDSNHEPHTITFGPEAYTGAIERTLIEPQPTAGGPPALVFNPLGMYPSEPPGSPLLDTGTNHGNGFLGSGPLDTDPRTPNPSEVRITFTKRGTYHYECVIHPGMDGTITVTR